MQQASGASSAAVVARQRAIIRLQGGNLGTHAGERRNVQHPGAEGPVELQRGEIVKGFMKRSLLVAVLFFLITGF